MVVGGRAAEDHADCIFRALADRTRRDTVRRATAGTLSVPGLARQGSPETVSANAVPPGGRAPYYMTGPDGEKSQGWWRVIAVAPPHSLEIEDGFADDSGRPNDDLPTTSIEVRLTAATAATTRMTMISRFASIADMEKIIATGTDEGMARAVGQIDAILVAPTRP